MKLLRIVLWRLISPLVEGFLLHRLQETAHRSTFSVEYSFTAFRFVIDGLCRLAMMMVVSTARGFSASELSQNVSYAEHHCVECVKDPVGELTFLNRPQRI